MCFREFQIFNLLCHDDFCHSIQMTSIHYCYYHYYVDEYRRDVWKRITAQLEQFRYVSVKEFVRTPGSAILSMEWVTVRCNFYPIVPYRMQIYSEFDLATLPRMVKFAELNISVIWLFTFSLYKPSLNYFLKIL